MKHTLYFHKKFSYQLLSLDIPWQKANLTLFLDNINIKHNLIFFLVVDGSSKESEKLINETWSSFLLVVLLGVALTILIIGIAVVLLARMNNASVQQRRRRRDAAAAATVATAGNHQFQGNNGKKYNIVYSIWIFSLNLWSTLNRTVYYEKHNHF